MVREHTTSKSLISIVGAVVVALGLVVLFGKLDGAAARLMVNVLGPAARVALELVLTLVPAVWQTLQGYASDHHWFSPCPLRMAATLWSVLHVVAGAA